MRKWLIPAVMLVLVGAAGCTEEEVKQADRPLLVTIEDLEPYDYDLDHLAHLQSFRRIRNLDGSLEIEYEFETPDTSEQILYLSVTAGYERTAREAVATYRMDKGAVGVGSRIGGVSVKEEPGFYRWGDESYFGFFVTKEGQRGGNVFAARAGNRTYLLILSGIYFDDREEWAAFIEPKLDYFARYNPEGWGAAGKR
jgi:hypothetical protein